MRVSTRGRNSTAQDDGGTGTGRPGWLSSSLHASPVVLRRLLYGFAIVVLTAFWGSVGYLVHDARETTYSEARKELLGAQYAMRAHAQRTLETAAAFLASVDAWLASASRTLTGSSIADLAPVIERLRRLDPDRPAIRLFDRQGRVLDGTGLATATLAGDREIVAALRNAPAGAMHVGLPALNPSTGADVLPIALKAGSNRFGVAYLAIEVQLDQFRRTYANLLISAPATYGILRSDSHILFQTPRPAKGLGWRIEELDLAQVRDRHGAIGVTEHERFDGIAGRRLSGFGFLEGFPAMTYASFLRDDIDARWRSTAVGAVVFALAVTLVTGLLTATALQLLSRYATEADRVRRALAEAEAASTAKTSFMGRMSHEFRTPLNAILGFSEVIRDGYLGPLPAAYREYGADIQRSGRHLLTLIDQVLDVAGMGAGAVTVNETVVDLETAVADAVEAVSAAAADRGVEIRVTHAAPGVRLVGDRRMLRQAVLGILSNAVKFSPRDGTVELAVTASGGGVQVTVGDRGPGIPEAVRAQIFEPFGERHAYVAGDREGLRLGLAIARSFMVLHDGTIAVEPRPGGGTRAVLTFPASRVVRSAEG